MSKPKSNKTKEKIRLAALNRTPELQKKMTDAATGWKQSDETKEKIRLAALNRTLETRAKMGKANIGKKFYFNPISGKTIFTHEECPADFLPGRYSDYVKRLNNNHK